jgi:phosphatidate phosphatase PAH1
MAAKKKYKIFKICKELNLGHDTINAFLEQSKLEVIGSGINGAVSEDTYLKILDKFSSDKDKAEALRKRRQTDSGETEKNITDNTLPTYRYLRKIGAQQKQLHFTALIETLTIELLSRLHLLDYYILAYQKPKH